MSARVVMAVDGGNSKTDLALVGEQGELLALVRGPGSSPHHIGTPACVELIDGLLRTAWKQAGLGDGRPEAAVALVAGADLDSEERELRLQASKRDWSPSLTVGNDTLAVLRAGSDAAFGVAVVCGAGINALGLAADGRRARFPALGPITGDWGGGADLGLAALGKAVRAEDGRGRPTVLMRLVPEYFSLSSGEDVALAVHRRELDPTRLVELAPLTLQAADDGDLLALELQQRLAGEVVAFARAAATRVLEGVARFDVVLGGSLLAGSASLAEQVIQRLRAELPAADPRICRVAPVAGAAVIGLERIGAEGQARERLRRELAAAVPQDATPSPNGAHR